MSSLDPIFENPVWHNLTKGEKNDCPQTNGIYTIPISLYPSLSASSRVL